MAENDFGGPLGRGGAGLRAVGSVRCRRALRGEPPFWPPKGGREGVEAGGQEWLGGQIALQERAGEGATPRAREKSYTNKTKKLSSLVYFFQGFSGSAN